MSNRRSGAWLLAGSLLLAALPAWAEIQVQVNGKDVQFGAVQPARIQGRVLIPLRAVVESLGAEVKWDGATQTVRGFKGEKEFQLQINSRYAQVNGKPITLEVPAQMMSGTTMVPLRFVAEALGAEVEWNAAAQQVVINSGEGGANELPVAEGRVTGELVSVRDNQITIRVNGVRQTYEVSQDAIILRGAEGRRGRTAELSELKPGDQVRLRVNANAGIAETVEATFKGRENPPPVAEEPIEGEVVAIRRRGNMRTVTVRTPQGREEFDVAEDAEIVRPRGNNRFDPIELDDIRVGDPIRYRAEGRVIRRIEGQRAANVPDRNNPNVPDRNNPNAPDRNRVTGEITAIRANSIVVRSGTDRATYDVDRDTVIFRSTGSGRGVRSTLEDLKIGDQVTLRVDRTGTIAEVIDAKGEAVVENPNPVPAADLKITSFTHDADQVLRSGSEVVLILRGSPGAQVTVDAGNLAKDVPLKEDPQQPGRYTGRFTIPKGVTAKDVPVVAQLRMGNRTAPLIQAGNLLSVDSEPPVIAEASPADRSETANQQPEIYVEVTDGAGSGIDPKSLRMVVGDRDVTDLVKVTRRFLIYTPRQPFAPGRVPVSVTIRDMAGNQTSVAWEFTIKPASSVLQSITHDGDRALRAGDVVTITARGQTKGRGTFSIGDIVKDEPLVESAPGVYVGKYTVRRGDQIAKAPVSVDFVGPDGTRVRQEASAPLNLVAGMLQAPKITAPVDMFTLEEQVVVEGTGTPGSRVIVEVLYRGRAFGALSLKGTFGSQEVEVDKNGRWRSDPFEVRLPLGVRRPEITVTAKSVDAAGTESQPTTVTLTTR